MKQFRILKHPDGTLVAVKDGFAWAGVVFGAFWLYFHKMFGLGTAILAMGTGAYLVFPSMDLFGAGNVANLVLCVAVGVFGNGWRLGSLRSRGFEEMNVVMAETADGVKAVYLRSPAEHRTTELEEPSLRNGS